MWDEEVVVKKVRDMSSGNEQQQRLREPVEATGERGKVGSTEELPLESSPYVKYEGLEDYKRKGYGTEGHLQVVDKQPGGGGGGGGTDAPTLSGSGLSRGQVRAAEAAKARISK